MTVAPLRHITHETAERSPPAPPVRRAGTDYETLIRHILADAEGRKSWPVLEALERSAETDSGAAYALKRIDALYHAREYSLACRNSIRGPAPEAVASALDQADHASRVEGFRLIFAATPVSKKLEILQHSKSAEGWSILGLPPCMGGDVEAEPTLSLERPAHWGRLLRTALRKRLSGDSTDPRVQEYRSLYKAYKQIESGRLQGKVSEFSLFLDLKDLESQLMPEHLRQAQSTVRAEVLTEDVPLGVRAESRVKSFLGSLRSLPSGKKETLLDGELSYVALKSPLEFRYYAARLLLEILRCPQAVSARMLPQYWSALARVARTEAGREQDADDVATGGGFARLLAGIIGAKRSGSGDSTLAQLELYRSGLTVNGTIRNYTYC